MDALTCPADRHDSRRAYREHGCRCPEAVQAVRQNWRRRRVAGTGTARPRSRDPHLDEMAIVRVCHGERLELTLAERAEVVRRLTMRGQSAREIAARLRLSERTVQRYRARIHSLGTQPVDEQAEIPISGGIAA